MATNTEDVFINFPYDASYERQFIALIAGLVCFGCNPHCALEIPDQGQGRLTKIVNLLTRCAASMHDLSNVRLSGKHFRVPRFNMPFELGIAFRISQQQKHKIFVLEKVDHRLEHSLNDLNGIDPQIHYGTCGGTLAAVANCFTRSTGHPSMKQMEVVRRKLAKGAKALKATEKAGTLFEPRLFRPVVAMATGIAHQQGIID